MQGVNLEKHLKDTFGYDLNAYGRDVAVLFAFGLALRLLTVIIMWLKDRSKKL